jgi:hypothetical protein
MMPRGPSATIPSAAKKPIAAFRLRRVVVCPQEARTVSNRFRLIGSPAAVSAARMYSTSSSVGFAPERAKRGRGEGGDTVIPPTEAPGGFIRMPGGQTLNPRGPLGYLR